MPTDVLAPSSALRSRPPADEFAAYFANYVSRVPDGDLLELLRTQAEELQALLRTVPDTDGGHRYAPGKWSVKEALGHVIDVERVMSFRALWIARGDRSPLPGFEQDDWVRATSADRRTMGDLLEEHRAVRAATVALLRPLDNDELRRRGLVSGFEHTPRALAWIIAGHERHHIETYHSLYGLGRG